MDDGNHDAAKDANDDSHKEDSDGWQCVDGESDSELDAGRKRAKRIKQTQDDSSQNRQPGGIFGQLADYRGIFESRHGRGLDGDAITAGPELGYSREQSRKYCLWTKEFPIPYAGPTMITFLSQEKGVNEAKMTENEILFHLGVAQYSQTHSLTASGDMAALMFRYVNEYLVEMKHERDAWRNLANREARDSTFYETRAMLRGRPSIDWQTQIPKSIADIRRWYVDGTHCMHGNLPHPAVRMLDAHHSYVSIQECIAHTFLHNGHYHDISAHPPDSEILQSIHFCPLAKSLYQPDDFRDKATIHLHLSEWSDDFEPSAGIKAGRGSVWAKVVSLVCTCTKHKNSPLNSFCVALGSKGKDHANVEREFAEELRVLAGPGFDVWHEGLRRQVVVKARLLFSIQDQPERRGAIAISAGNSTYTARFGYSYNIKENRLMLQSCDSCLRGLFLDKSTTGCEKCYNWEFVTERPDGSRTDNESAAISFERLLSACRQANTNLLRRTWTREEADKYLTENGIVKKICTKIIDHAHGLRSLQEAKIKAEGNQATETDKKAYQNLSLAAETTPDNYKLYDGPPTWNRNFNIQQHVDAPMHLLFLGIIKKITRWIARWVVDQGFTTAFSLHYVKEFRTQQIKDLHLGWCKCERYTGGKLGGWISESYVAHARLLPWFYGWLDSLVQGNRSENTEKHREPTTAPDVWLKSDCTKWLRVRGQKVGKKEVVRDLRLRIIELKRQDGGPPPVVAPKDCNAGKVLEMVHALHSMIALLMSRDDKTSDPDWVARLPTEVTRRVKLFLTLFARCDEGFHSGKGKDVHAWISCYNFTTLLNLPQNVRNFRTMRDLWEGGFAGEGSVRFIKPVVARLGKVPNWPRHALKTIHQNRAFKDIRRQVAKNDTRKQKNINDFHCYKTVSAAKQAMSQPHPLSVITYGNKFYMVTRKKDNRCTRVLQLYRKSLAGIKVGLHYFVWECDQEEEKVAIEQEHVTSYCLFLPLPDPSKLVGRTEVNDSSEQVVYAVINSAWKHLGTDGTFYMPDTPYIAHESKIPQQKGFLEDLLVPIEPEPVLDLTENGLSTDGSLNDMNPKVNVSDDSIDMDEEEYEVIEENTVELFEADSDSDDDAADD